MKRGRMSTEEKEQILSNRALGVEQLAEKFDRSVKLIQELLQTAPEAPEKPQHVTSLQTGMKSFARKNGAVAMTDASAARGDDFVGKSTLDPSYIHIMKSDEE